MDVTYKCADINFYSVLSANIGTVKKAFRACADPYVRSFCVLNYRNQVGPLVKWRRFGCKPLHELQAE